MPKKKSLEAVQNCCRLRKGRLRKIQIIQVKEFSSSTPLVIERMNNRKKTCASGAGGGGNDGTVKRPWLNQASFMYIEGNFFDDVAQTEDASAQGQRQGNARKRPGGKLSSSLLKFLNADPSKFPHLCTMQNFVCKSMRGTKFRDLAIRLNTPYVYCHNGDCEHPFVFSDVRMFESTDPGHPSMYPFLTFQRHHNRATQQHTPNPQSQQPKQHQQQLPFSSMSA